MGPGQAALSLGTLGAWGTGFEGQAFVSLVVPVSQRWNLSAAGGTMIGANGLMPFDSRVMAKLELVDKPTLRMQGGLGATIPTGVGKGLMLPGATGSFDPRAELSIVYGSDWLLLGELSARVPVYAGRDGSTDPWIGRARLEGARRIGAIDGIAHLGLTTWRQGMTADVAATGGLVFNPSPKWGVSAQAWVGVWNTAYLAAGSLSATRVLGDRRETPHHED
jgi:hypothetical protein